MDGAASCIRLDHLPVGNVTVQSACGQPLDPNHFLVDYTTGTLYSTCPTAGQLQLCYHYHLAETYILQAIRDLGLRLPQRNTICTPLFADTNQAPLPAGVHHIHWVKLSDCLCGQSRCDRCATRPACHATANWHWHCDPCGLYRRGNWLIINPATCTDQMLHLCYEGGYTLDRDNCFPDLTADLADLILLKAQAIAYTNPRLFFDQVAALTDTNALTDTETITVTKTYGTCNRETGTTTTKTSTNMRLTQQLLTHYQSLAQEYQQEYQQAILLRTQSATIGRSCQSPYRAQHRVPVLPSKTQTSFSICVICAIFDHPHCQHHYASRSTDLMSLSEYTVTLSPSHIAKPMEPSINGKPIWVIEHYEKVTNGTYGAGLFLLCNYDGDLEPLLDQHLTVTNAQLS